MTKDHPEGCVASLTSLPRKDWAKIRDDYFSVGLNKQALEAIEEALFVVGSSFKLFSSFKLIETAQSQMLLI